MSFQVTTAFVQQYTTNVNLLLQQSGSRFRNAVTEGSYTGKAAKAVEQIGAVVAQKRTTRHSDTPLISTPHDARWVFPVDYDWADLIDDVDKLRMLIDPQSPYAINGANSIGRAMDDEIVSAFFGTSKTGENGTTNTAFPAGNVVALGTSGMTVKKLRAAKRILMANEVDLDTDPLYCGITAAQHDDLLGQTQIVSTEFNDRPILHEGRLKSYLGINFIHSERLNQNAGATGRACPVWAKSGMHLGMWNDLTTKISERPDKNYANQVFVTGTVGATRCEEGKVVQVDCAE